MLPFNYQKMKTIENSKTELLGIYAVKSPYHAETHYLPFIILGYAPENNSYDVLTIECKGKVSYKVDTSYSEKSILELISGEIIVKIATPENFKGNDHAKELISQYSNAENQEL